MDSLMMNSMRASPTPSFGSSAALNANPGLPRLSMIAVFGRRSSPSTSRAVFTGRAPLYTRPTSPSAQETVTTAPPFSAFLAPSAPTTAGMPSSRATIAA